ncbi:hypothetical protein ACV4QK_16880 [Alteromonas macleodii]
MPPLTNNILVISLLLFFLLTVISSFKYKEKGIALFQLIILIVLTSPLVVFYEFPIPKVSFGNAESLKNITLVYFALVAGMIANHLFFTTKFNFMLMLKPILVSPIVMMPLFSLVENSNEDNSIKLISLIFIAFQNGFFWKSVFEQVEKKRIGAPKNA